jgi:adenine-specific DNA-methyltransferase
MKKLTAEDRETRSPDLVVENLSKLTALFPEAVNEDGVNVDVLQQLIGKTVKDTEEKFGLSWNGKRRARQFALTPSTGTLRPCREDSEGWEDTQNLMIEGDNLEVLKLLQKSYAGRFKLIYIDPPYNTGDDFVYPDDYQDSIRNYLERTEQVDGAGRKNTSNPETSGRFHTDWLNMIYPRLKVASTLLKKSGVIFISIDDTELPALRFMCDEVFGAENFVGCCAWERKRKGSHLSQEFTQRTEHLVIYAKGGSKVTLFGEAAGAEEDQPLIKRTNAIKELVIPAGIVETGMPDQVFKPGSYGSGSSSVELLERTKVEAGRFTLPVKLKGPFIWTQANLDLELAAGARFFIRTNNFSLRALKALDRQGFKALSSLLTQEVGTNEDALTELALLFGVEEDSVPFDYPKPTSYIRKVVSSATHWEPDAWVLDFFAGSGTTAQAVLAENASDGGSRRYVLVQLPEPLDPEQKEQKVAAEFCDHLGKPRTIAELTKERLRRMGKKIRDENPMFAGDLGFRVFKLASSNIRAWEPDRDNLPKTLLDSVEHMKPDRTVQDILFELLLKLGLDLTVPIEEKCIVGKAIHSIGAGTLLVCLDQRIANREVEPLALGIAAWHKELAPAGESQIVFRDSAFADDVAKTNLTAILQQNGLENVRSL